MLSRVHSKLGTAGLVVAIVALVAALGGGAYAASGGLSGKQKKEVEKISKKYAGKPGAPGANGNNGAPGAKGDTGAAGSSGTSGTNAEGIPFSGQKTVGSVTCKEGGVEVKSAKPASLVCNGAKGVNGQTGFTKTLPSGETETGTLAFEIIPTTPPSSGGKFRSISFAIPLDEPVLGANIHLIDLGNTSTECPGSFENPIAVANGGESTLCIYKGLVFSNISNVGFFPTVAGTYLNLSVEETANPASGIASFAVTAG